MKKKTVDTPEIPPGLEDHLTVRNGKVVRKKWDMLGIPSPQEAVEALKRAGMLTDEDERQALKEAGMLDDEEEP